MVSIEMRMAVIPAAANIHHVRSIRYAKLCSQLFIANHARGTEIISARKTSFRKSLENFITMLPSVAPRIYRILSSFLRCSAENMASPNNPIHDIMIASSANTLDSLLTTCSLLYSFAYC